MHTNPQDTDGEYILYNLGLAHSVEFTPKLDSDSNELSENCASTTHKSVCYLESFIVH